MDHFDLAAGVAREVEDTLAALADVDPPEPGDEDRAFAFVRAGNAKHRGLENTLIGRVVVEQDCLRLETNSVARADELRGRIEDACGDHLRHRIREHSDPTATFAGSLRDTVGHAAAPEIPPDQVNELLRQVKARHYADWADHPLPALDGKTPRQAVGSKAGRQQVELLLKDCEHGEGRLPAGQQFDFSGLRRELGL